MQDTKNKPHKQIRVRWLAADTRTDLRSVLEMLEAEKSVAIDLYNAVLHTRDLDFVSGTTTVNHKRNALDSLKNKYALDVLGADVCLTRDDVVKCLQVFDLVFDEGQATTMSGVTNVKPQAERIQDLLAALREVDLSVVKKHKDLGDVRKLAFHVLCAIGILPNAISDLSGAEQKSVWQNVIGKIGSLQECAARHADEYKQHRVQHDVLANTFGANFDNVCADLLSTGHVRKLDARAVAMLENLVTEIASGSTYKDFIATSRHTWKPSDDLWSFCVEHADTFNSVMTNSKFKSLTVDEDTSIPAIALLNEKQWLATHSSGVKQPSYTGNDFGLMLGDNYLSIVDLAVVSVGSGKVLRIVFGTKANRCSCDFVLSKSELLYRNDLEIVKLGGKNSEFEVRCHNRVFVDNGARVELIEMRGIFKEPKICVDHGVLGIRLPISWETETQRAGAKVADRNKVVYTPGDKPVKVHSMVSKFSKESKSFNDLIDFRNSTAIEGTIRWAAFDYGETENIVKIFETRTYENNTLREYFDVADSNVEVACCRFSDYQSNKTAHARGDVDRLGRRDLRKCLNAIKYLRSLVGLARCYVLKNDQQYFDKSFTYRAAGWNEFKDTIGANDLGDFDFVFKYGVMDRLDASADVEFQDVVRDPSYLVNKLHATVSKLFYRHKDERRTKFSSQHQHDYVWLECIDRMISLATSVSRFGLAPLERGSEAASDFSKNLKAYRENVVKQYRKEVAAWLRDACVTYGVRNLAIEELKARNYISEDSDANRKRALFSPAELQNDIRLACDLHDINVIEVDETLTSRVGPDGSFGFRTPKEGRWENLYLKSGDTVTSVGADENACSNIVLRALTSGASRPKFSASKLKTPKKLGAAAKMGILYYGRKVQSKSVDCVLDSTESISDTDFTACFDAVRIKIESDLGTAVQDLNGRDRDLYVDAGVFIKASEKRTRIENIRNNIEAQAF